MVLLVPISPEVPPNRSPRLWPALVLVLSLMVAFHFAENTIEADLQYVANMGRFLFVDGNGSTRLSDEGQFYLSKRPLLMLASAKGDWSLERLVISNFIHGSVGHLLLNILGVFAGARICSTFLPFSYILFIFLFGGTLGLFSSIRLTTEISNYIPHVGASGGIFALMGTYYVFNFRFRTRYIFWFPSKQGLISLRTDWFFFVDVLLLELVLTAAQLLPQRTDTVDHIAHVVGFTTGIALALLIRLVSRWEPWLQTRAEYDEWRRLRKIRSAKIVEDALRSWCDLLSINPYNDLIKIRLCRVLAKHGETFSPLSLSEAFAYLSPTFLRLHTASAAEAIVHLVDNGVSLPREWLSRTPYDSIIRLAQCIATTPERQRSMFRLVSDYRTVHPEGPGTGRKLELLLNRLEPFMTADATANRAASSSDPEGSKPR